MADITEIIGTSREEFLLDGSNEIDFFPVIISNPLGGTAPDAGNITIQGVTFATVLYAVNETQGVKIELNHMYKAGGHVDFHIRFFPVDDNAGTVNFSFNYFILHVDGTTTAGTLVNLAEKTIVAGDKTANKAQYAKIDLTATGFVSGDMIIGQFKRTAGTYGSDVAIMEIGCHGAVGKVGHKIIT